MNRSGTFTDSFFVLVFSFTLFLSASLMFVVEPMIGKMMLPVIGGAPTGWLVTMAYFQLVLLLGYVLALALSRLPVRIHILVLCGLLGLGLVKLPLRFSLLSNGPLDLYSLFLSLASMSALPMIAVSALSPSLQRLFALGAGSKARNPYFLFAASNMGSLGGLLAYPLVIERLSGLSDQAAYWHIGYTGLIVFCLLCLLQKTTGRVEPEQAVTQDAVAPTWRERALWVALAFIPSSLMLGLTASVTADTGSVPFFWVLPLALYLWTFILAFRQPEAWTCNNLALQHLLSIATFAFLVFGNNFSVGGQNLVQTIVQTAVFVLSARLCHGLLAARKPHAAYLSDYYVWIAVGGALGGLFNAFLAPLLFTWPIEFTLIAGASCLVHRLLPQNPVHPKYKYAVPVLFLVAAGTSLFRTTLFVDSELSLGMGLLRTVQIMSIVTLSLRPKALGALVLLLSLSGIYLTPEHSLLEIKRNFFGVLRVVDQQTQEGANRSLMHGTTLHGIEQIKPERDTTPNTYYTATGPLGDIMKTLEPQSVGIIGLGTGATLCYTAPQRHFTVYEIDADVVDLAKRHFDFMRTCGMPEIHIGDGRKLLETAPPSSYDLLIVDAFTSDAIPVHLLTREALQLYRDRLKPGGLLAIHISNRYYDLRYPLADTAQDLGLKAKHRAFVPDAKAKEKLATSSKWVALARDNAPLDALPDSWAELPAPSGHPWSDDYSDTLSQLVILKKIGL